jgi:hypothetical protein
MLVFGIIMPEDCAARAVSCEDAFVTDEDEMFVLDSVGPLFLAAECAPIRSRVKKAARAIVVNISVINGFFVMAICMCATSPS